MKRHHHLPIYSHATAADDVLLDDGQHAPTVPGDARQLTPEGQLLLAVLKQAMDDYLSDPRGKPHAEATLWFSTAGTAPGSFHWCCQYLGLDPDYLWRHRERWVSRQRQAAVLLVRREAA